jgi:hypothetical protein
MLMTGTARQSDRQLLANKRGEPMNGLDGASKGDVKEPWLLFSASSLHGKQIMFV